ncbi:MAG TPA: thymidine phosphorylase [Acidobacteriaceae bacterium]|nr:thymidine phosphorylase [Acidobacteriaceae bacterium]
MTIHPIEIIQRKRDGLVLSQQEIQVFVRALVARRAPGETPTDAQVAAFLMAVFIRGLVPEELAALTQAMRFSGEVFDSAPLQAFVVDKHSTGGVGDKTSLLIAPIVAAAGLKDPMISGRSLGHTGGTLDKLETIPGFRTQLSLEELSAVVQKCGLAMAGQTTSLVPADRILYALRDHTGTVESPYLIAASIMSKKLAAGLNGLVLDVKTGSGAFLREHAEAQLLARLMVETGELAGVRTVALLTSMDEPLGRFAGNWVEVMECLEVFQHFSPDFAFTLSPEKLRLSQNLLDLTHRLAGQMLAIGGKAETSEEGAVLSARLLADGSAYRSFVEMVELQSDDVTAAALALHAPTEFHRPAVQRCITAGESGFLGAMDCTQVGWAVQRLGAGRARPGDPVSAHAGIEMHVKVGDRVVAGQPLVTLFADDAALLDEPESMLRETLRVVVEPPIAVPLVREVVTAK